MARRTIVQIDEAKCDGCGLCIPTCAEGALQIIAGKARLVSDVYCDGLGACLGACPQDAIKVVQREAAAFDEQAARTWAEQRHATPTAAKDGRSAGAGCPGSVLVDLGGDRPRGPDCSAATRETPAAIDPSAQASSRGAEATLRNWPVQLHLVSPDAAFLRGAELLLVADCVPLAMADFHAQFLGGRPVVIGCPKLDDAESYVRKLSAILTVAEPSRLTVVHMEVPCCSAMVRIARAAGERAGRQIPLEDVTVSIGGKVVSRGFAG